MLLVCVACRLFAFGLIVVRYVLLVVCCVWCVGCCLLVVGCWWRRDCLLCVGCVYVIVVSCSLCVVGFVLFVV